MFSYNLNLNSSKEDSIASFFLRKQRDGLWNGRAVDGKNMQKVAILGRCSVVMTGAPVKRKFLDIPEWIWGSLQGLGRTLPAPI